MKNKIFIGILISVLIVFLAVFAIKNFVPDTFEVMWFDIGSSSETSDDETLSSNNPATDDGSSSGGTPSSTNKPSNDNVSSEDVPPTNNDSTSTDNTDPIEDGLSRATAYTIDLNMQYSMTMEKGKQENWFCFITGNEKAVYRISVNPIINDTPIMSYMRVAIYGENNIKIDDTSAQREEGFIDLLLSSNTKYYLKVSSNEDNFSTGDYGFYVLELPCDEATGTDKASAISIEAEKDYTGVLTSTLSNWYVLDEPGQYTFILHNTNVGCKIEYSGIVYPGNGALFSGWVKSDESSFEHQFTLAEHTKLYIEIKAVDKTANGQYLFSIIKTN